MPKKKTKEPEAPPKDEFDPLEIVSKKPLTVVLMLDSPEESVLQSACEALFKFSEKCEENRLELLNLGALDRLLKLITSEDKVIKRNSTMCLGTMAQNAVVRKALKKTECVTPLITLLGPEEDVLCHEFSSLALASMAGDFSSKVEIFEQGGLQPLINLLLSQDCDVQKNSVEAISLLVEDYQSRSAIRDLNGIQPLIDLLSSEYAIIQKLALDSLASCSLDVDNRAAIRELGGLEKLVEFIGNKDYDDLHVKSLHVLSNCLQDDESMQVLQASGGLQKLLAFTAESALPEVQEHACKAIASAAKIDDNRKIFHEQECEKTLITLLMAESGDVQASAATALGVMSENLSSRDMIGRLEGIQPLIGLLQSDNPDCREAASLALANLTSSNNNNSCELVDKNGIDPLITLLGDERPLSQANAAVTLTNLATNESWRAEIQRLGIIPGLVGALQSSNTIVQSKASVAVAAFVCDYDTRSEFRTEGGLQYLVSLLQAGNEEVRRSASWAVLMCGNDPTTATELCRLGGLDALQEISQSVTRQSGFASAALECLLDSNLPTKYSLTGFLSSSNIIQDRFYDYGQIRPGTKLASLEELSSQPVDHRRPVILVNSKTPEKKPMTPPVIKEPEKLVPTNERNTNLGRSSKTNMKTKSRKEKEAEQKAREQELIEQQIQQQQAMEEAWQPPADDDLAQYIEEVQTNIQPLSSTVDQVVALAQYVSNKMGGIIEKGKLAEFSYELPISELKYELESNVIPIGKIRTGIFYHRALLFKVLADRIAVGCSLFRGEYNRAWNEVQLCEESKPGHPVFPPKSYIVDLMYEPGKLMRTDSSEASLYQRLA